MCLVCPSVRVCIGLIASKVRNAAVGRTQLLSAGACSTAPAVIDRSISAAECRRRRSAVNQQIAAVAAVDRWDRQTGGQADGRPTVT